MLGVGSDFLGECFGGLTLKDFGIAGTSHVSLLKALLMILCLKLFILAGLLRSGNGLSRFFNV